MMNTSPGSPRPLVLSEAYFGVPVFIQLKVSLLVSSALERQALPYSDAPKERQWIPRVMAQRANPKDPESPVMNASTDVFEFAVLRQVDDPKFLEVQWSVPSPNGLATMATLVPVENIAQVTRVVQAPDGPPLIKV